MPQTVEQLSRQLESYKRKIEDIPQTIGGAYNRKYYSMKAQIKNTEALIDKIKWNEFLAK